MKSIISVLVLGSLCLFAVAANSPFKRNFERLHHGPSDVLTGDNVEVTTNWIEQKLDNFNESDTRTWKMRYMATKDYFEEGGPIFVFVGGEWTINEGYLRGGHTADLAKELKAYMFYTEHRYYGDSLPTEDKSVENLKYLNVHQSLADLAHFIKTMKATIPGLEKAGVIVVGCSYAATMVTWFRRVYPELSNGAWASSAPVFAKVDFEEYKETVGDSIREEGGDACYQRVERAVKKLEDLAENNPQELRSTLGLCEQFDAEDELNVWSLFSTISDAFAGLVQNHNSGDIPRACQTILSKDDDVEGLNAWLLNQFPSGSCLAIDYKSFLDEKSNVEWDGTAMRQWYYQRCSEYGWYQTSASAKQPFGKKFPVDLYVRACQDVFGKEFNAESIEENVKRTNERYGGLNPEVTNVYFTHGGLDPWQRMGVLKDLNKYSPAAVIPSYGHCKDLRSVSISDTDAMQKSKERIRQLSYQWLGLKPPQ